MCHHYIAGRTRTAAGRAVSHHWDDEFSLRGNLYQLELPTAGFYPLDVVPIVRLDDAGERTLLAAQWGFLPNWWRPTDKTPKRTTFQRKCFNARCEEVHAKPPYRQAFGRRRCLLPGFEFLEKGHYFRLADDRPFAFAGLWEEWRGADGEVVTSCTMLTTEPNALVADIGHHRMPVVFHSAVAYEARLNPEIVEREPLEELMRPTPASIWACRVATNKSPIGDDSEDPRLF